MSSSKSRECVVCKGRATHEWVVYDHNGCGMYRETVLTVPACTAHLEQVADETTREHFHCMGRSS